jgi:hypothetical protein
MQLTTIHAFPVEDHPAGIRSIARMRACLVSGRIAVFEDEGASRVRDLDLLVDREVERAAAFSFDLGLVMGSSERVAIARKCLIQEWWPDSRRGHRCGRARTAPAATLKAIFPLKFCKLPYHGVVQCLRVPVRQDG